MGEVIGVASTGHQQVARTTVYQVEIDPIDPLLFGDNRPARAGVDHLIRDKEPSPILIHGAIGTCIFESNGSKWTEEVLGPRLDDILTAPAGKQFAELLGYCYADPRGGLWFPKPLSFRCLKPCQGWPPFPGDLIVPRGVDKRSELTSCMLPCILDGDPLPGDEDETTMLVSLEVLGRILRGHPGARVPLGNEVLRLTEVFRRESRAGLGMDNRTGRAEEGILFTRPYRRFQPAEPDPTLPRLGYGFTAWFQTREPLQCPIERVGFLGGDRGRARFEFQALDGARRPLQEMLDEIVKAVANTKGFLAYLLTPMIWEGQWPQVLTNSPIAAAIGKPLYASGWNTRLGCPRPLHALIPAGSIFFYEWPNAQPDSTIIQSNWLSSVSAKGACAGFGRILVGVWR
ncbi:MAG: hypothetical protein HYX75_25635 [Acidobacteria bacterium]|nr:hypothetical protein [Acidobacteriota bacterium]